MSRTELIFTDEEIDRLANKIADKIKTEDGQLHYGELLRCKNCTIHFVDKKRRDEFLIKDNNGKIIGEFKEVVKCEECVHRRRSERNLWCDIFDKIMPEDGFCCFGDEDYGVQRL